MKNTWLRDRTLESLDISRSTTQSAGIAPTYRGGCSVFASKRVPFGWCGCDAVEAPAHRRWRVRVEARRRAGAFRFGLGRAAAPIRATPPMYGLSTFGTLTVPSGRWKFSRIATMHRLVATRVLLRVW